MSLELIMKKTTTIQSMLENNRGNVTRVADMLDVNRATLRLILDTGRDHVVLVKDNGDLKLLK